MLGCVSAALVVVVVVNAVGVVDDDAVVDSFTFPSPLLV